MKVFYGLFAANLIFAAAMGVWGAIQLPAPGQAMLGVAVMAGLHLALNAPHTSRGTFWLRAIAALSLLASSMFWLIPAVQGRST